MFRMQVAASPNKVAIVGDKGRQLTFKELDHITDVLSKSLRNIGVEPETSVGIYMEKCIDYAVSYIAILKAGKLIVLKYNI